MQSLKSTAVAMVLLAISFGLYNFSSPTTSSETENLLSELNINDGSMSGFDQMVSSPNELIEKGKSALSDGVNSLQAKASEFKQSLPDLPDMTNNLSTAANQLKENASQLTQNAQQKFNDVSNQFKDAVNQLEAPQLNSPAFDNGSFEPPSLSTRQVIDESRDDGLIDALGNNGFQPVSTMNPPAQPIANSDTSRNSLATDLSRSANAYDSTFDSSVRSADGPIVNGANEPAFGQKVFNSRTLNDSWSQVDTMVQQENFRGALGLLSRYYRNDDLNGPQRQRLQGWLDALAAKVIYSAEHNFHSKPYIVKQGETVEEIALRWNVPPQLVYNVNQDKFINSSQGSVLSPGTELKMLTGPFEAEIDMSENMMTLFLKGLYAGRFPVRVGVSGNPVPGSFQVMAKSPEGFTWRDANGTDYPPGSPENGYGRHWIGLSGSLCIHATKDGAADGHRGCIGLTEKDAKDVFGILAQNSTVTIVR